MIEKYRTQSAYCYPGTDVLKNKFDIKNPQELENMETTLTTLRLAELYNKPLYGSFGLKHLQKIHRYIFQDLYPFAGEFRLEQISKGNTSFAHPMHLESYGQDVLRELKFEKLLKGLDKEGFAARSSYYLSEINMLHPFREGNGRTQREFFRLLAMKNGYELDWTKVDRERMMEASIKSVIDSNAYKDVFMECIENDTPNLEMIKDFKRLSTKQKNLRLEL